VLKKSSYSVIGLACVAIWTLGCLSGCSDSKENIARKELVNATRLSDEFCRAASAEMVNPLADANNGQIAEFLDKARQQLTAAINKNAQYAGELTEELAMARASLAQIENVEAQYKFLLASRQMIVCDSMMNEIFNLFSVARATASAAKAAKKQTEFDSATFTAKIDQNAQQVKATKNRLQNIKAALDEKKDSLDKLTAEMNDKSLQAQRLMRESQLLPAGKSGSKLDQALKLNDEIGKIQKSVTVGEGELAGLAMLIESLELKIKNQEEYGKSLDDSQKIMNDLAIEAKARADVLDTAATAAHKRLAEKCSEFNTLQKEFCANVDACQNGFEKSADSLKRALQNASDDFRNSMQLKQAELALAAASIELDMIAYKKQVENLQNTLTAGNIGIAVDESVKKIAADALAEAAVKNCQDSISTLERVLRDTPSTGKWRMHSALASANITLSRSFRAAGNASLADNALKNAQTQLAEARNKSKWLAKASLDAIETQIRQAK